MGNGVTEINTPSCTTQKSCTPSTVSPCRVSNCTCGCTPCRCQQVGTAAPFPYYNNSTAVEESHTQVLVQQTFTTTVTTGAAFNMPACGASITVIIPGLQKILVGGYLWNVTYGYLHITAFDYVTSRVTLKNECNSQNASPGTSIPACTMFNVVDPPAGEQTDCPGDSVYVTEDFIVPAVNGLAAIAVSSVVGLVEFQVVQIVTGKYSIQSIVDSHTIIIKNDLGTGGTPGTTISAKDIAGHCIAPVTPIDVSPCVQTPVASGAIVVCKGGAASTLDASSVGQIPVCINPSTNEVEFQNLTLPVQVCTSMTACATIVGVGVGTTVSIIVADVSAFSIGDLVLINFSGIETIRWVITNVDSVSKTLTLSSVDSVGSTITVSDLTEVCKASCCDQVAYDIASGRYVCNYDWHYAFAANDLFTSGTVATNPAVHVGDPVFTGNAESVIIENPTCSTMMILYALEYGYSGVYGQSYLGDVYGEQFSTYHSVDEVSIGASFPAPTWVVNKIENKQLYACSCNDPPFIFYSYRDYCRHGTYSLPPGKKVKINGRADVEYLCNKLVAPGHVADLFVIYTLTKIYTLEVAVQTSPAP